MSTPVIYNSEVTEDDALIELAEILVKIDTDKQLAKLNETTISDNNGGRIYL